MIKILVSGLAIILVLLAGCTTVPPDTGTPLPASTGTTTPAAAPSSTTVSNPQLTMNASVVLGNDSKQITVYLANDSFEIDPLSEPGQQTITIYVYAHNTGSVPVQLVWFSRLTDTSGRIYGGIGISHGGNGARTDQIYPNMTEAARDYVVVPAADFPQLAKGAILDVYFMEKESDADRVSLVPDYHVRWAIDPGVIA